MLKFARVIEFYPLIGGEYQSNHCSFPDAFIFPYRNPTDPKKLRFAFFVGSCTIMVVKPIGEQISQPMSVFSSGLEDT